MKEWNLIIDVKKCEDCNNCFLACKDEFVGNDFPPYSMSQPRHGHRWINLMRKERGRFPMVDVAYRPTPCMHCDNAPCIKKAPEGAVYRRDDGIVIIDPKKAKGEKSLVDACPYGAIWWNEDLDLPQKCTFCVHLLENGWKEPRCVQACPTGAMRVIYGKHAKMREVVESENLICLHSEYGTKPHVYYKNLYRYSRCFIAGSVAYEHDGKTDCAAGSVVLLKKGSDKVDETVTDSFGDFKFDNLEEKSGTYRIEILLGEFERKTLELDLIESHYAGVILFK